MEIICINDKFTPEWEVYFKHWGIIKPIQDKIYTIRDYVPNTVGGPGLLLAEIVNKPTPRISPSTGMKGMSEQNWAIHRFTHLNGDKLVLNEVKESVNEIERAA